MKNQIGQTADVTSIDLKREDEALMPCTTPPAFPITNWKTGEIKDLVWSGCEASFSDAGFAQGDKGKLLINMSFYAKSSGPTYSQSAEGQIIATVQ